MRASFLIPLTLLVAASGCGSAPEETGRAPTVPARDLTLERSPLPAVQVASPLEVPRPQPEQAKVHRRSPRRVAAPARQPAPPDAAPVTDAAAAPPVARAAAPAARRVATDAPADPRALEPGQTVTVIPASSGPSVGSDPADAPPSRAGRAIMLGGGHGGNCQPHGAMRLLAPAFRPSPR